MAWSSPGIFRDVRDNPRYRPEAMTEPPHHRAWEVHHCRPDRRPGPRQRSRHRGRPRWWAGSKPGHSPRWSRQGGELLWGCWPPPRHSRWFPSPVPSAGCGWNSPGNISQWADTLVVCTLTEKLCILVLFILSGFAFDIRHVGTHWENVTGLLRVKTATSL